MTSNFAGPLHPHTFQVGAETVSALLLAPDAPRARYLFGHGAGAGMEHAFMESAAAALAEHGIATFRYNFPYREHRRGRPDWRPVLLSTVRAAAEAAAAALPGVPLIAGGKSMGGRMTSLAQAEAPLPGVRGLVFVGFPLHEAKKPGIQRAEHLASIDVPMLFLQGTRDAMAEFDLIRGVVAELGARATLQVVEGADHGFRVLKRSGRAADEIMEELAGAVGEWLSSTLRI
ncbi:MAG TPA: alpha/beta family hydrolase [Longimicrobiaceae bacterium]|nr:alpha/beta family hydrolase [Longimicrobiaceae bacterium]